MAIDTDSKSVFLFQGVGCNLDKMLNGLGEEQLCILKDLCRESSDYAELDLVKYLDDRNIFNKETDKIYAEWLITGLSDIAVFKSFENNGIKPDYIVGYSLGLNNAMHCTGAIPLKGCAQILRGVVSSLEESRTRSKVGYDMGMVIGLELNVVNDLIERCSSIDRIKVASENSEFMIVMSGEKNEIQKVLDAALDEGALKAFLLCVGSPFHTSMMKDYSSCYFNALKEVQYSDAKYPVISIFSQNELHTADEMYNEQCRNFLEQMKWKDTIDHLESIGVRNFYDMSATAANKKSSVINKEDSRFITIKSLKKIGGH